MKISKTAYCLGYGSMPWKACAGLTQEERAAVRNGEIVIFLCDKLSNGNNGTKLRVAYVDDYGWKRRVPCAEEIAEYEKMSGDTTHCYPQKMEVTK